MDRRSLLEAINIMGAAPVATPDRDIVLALAHAGSHFRNFAEVIFRSIYFCMSTEQV